MGLGELKGSGEQQTGLRSLEPTEVNANGFARLAGDRMAL
jgi:hypothetical protein